MYSPMAKSVVATKFLILIACCASVNCVPHHHRSSPSPVRSEDRGAHRAIGSGLMCQEMNEQPRGDRNIHLHARALGATSPKSITPERKRQEGGGITSIDSVPDENWKPSPQNDDAPKPVDGECPEEYSVRYRYHKESNTCQDYRSDNSPVCGEFMKFYKDPTNEITGDCDCKEYVNKTFRPLVFWENTNRCYWLYDQGPCACGEWLVLIDNTTPVCRKRSCPDHSTTETSSWFRYRGNCYLTGTKAFCPRNQTAWYDRNDTVPKCTTTKIEPMEVRNIIGAVNNLPCAAGHKKSLNGQCQRTATFVK